MLLVEGGAKGVRKFKKLVLKRMKWNNENEDEDKLEETSEPNDKPKHDTPSKPNKCWLIWEVCKNTILLNFNSITGKYFETKF